MAKEVFVSDEGGFAADFSAFVASTTVRYLRIGKPSLSQAGKVKAMSLWKNFADKASHKGMQDLGLLNLLEKLQKKNAGEFGDHVPTSAMQGLKGKFSVSALKEAILKAAAEQETADNAAAMDGHADDAAEEKSFADEAVVEQQVFEKGEIAAAVLSDAAGTKSEEIAVDSSAGVAHRPFDYLITVGIPGGDDNGSNDSDDASNAADEKYGDMFGDCDSVSSMKA